MPPPPTAIIAKPIGARKVHAAAETPKSLAAMIASICKSILIRDGYLAHTANVSLTRPIVFWIAMLAAVISAVVLLREVLLPFVAGMVLAYLLNPLAIGSNVWG